jgi:predicted glycoside hydrolase/deacetylase ChbG (UPF0249 family)
MSQSPVQLITRGDDAGSAHGANRAILEACDAGTLRNVSVMVPGPAFKEAAGMFAGRTDICLGLHVTLNAEWERVRWGPVLPKTEVPSLVDAEGNFTYEPRVLYERGVVLDEIMAEVEAQLARARAYSLRIKYLDEHMGVGGQLPGLETRLAALAEREGLVYARPIPFLPDVNLPGSDLVARWITRIERADPGTYVLLTHPGMDDAEMRQFYLIGGTPGEIARERNAERLALTDPRWIAFLKENNIPLLQYTDMK